MNFTRVWLSLTARDERFHPKEPVLGIEIDGQFKAYPFVELEKSATVVNDTVAGRQIVVTYDSRNRTATAEDASGDMLPGVIAYWFAWYAFHPDTGVYRAN